MIAHGWIYPHKKKFRVSLNYIRPSGGEPGWIKLDEPHIIKCKTAQEAVDEAEKFLQGRITLQEAVSYALGYRIIDVK